MPRSMPINKVILKKLNTNNPNRRSLKRRKKSNRRSTPNASPARKINNRSMLKNRKRARASPHRSMRKHMLNSMPNKGRLQRSSIPHSARKNRSQNSNNNTLTPNRSKDQTTPASPRSTLRSAAMNPLDALPNSSAYNTPHGTSMARNTGNPTIALGSSAEAITVTAFPKTASADTLAATTASASPDCPSCESADFHASSTRVIGSVKSTPGRKPGAMTGTTTTMSM